MEVRRSQGVPHQGHPGGMAGAGVGLACQGCCGKTAVVDGDQGPGVLLLPETI